MAPGSERKRYVAITEFAGVPASVESGENEVFFRKGVFSEKSASRDFRDSREPPDWEQRRVGPVLEILENLEEVAFMCWYYLRHGSESLS